MNGSNGAQSMKVYSMIKKIKRKDLDLAKYSTCLENSINYRIYAEYWYLDCLTNEQWDCLVYNDYEAIMPLPYQKFLGIKIVSQPLYCQQLGVFHYADFTEEIFKQFQKKLHSLIVRGYHFNEENTALFNPKGVLKINQILNLDHSYEHLYANFRRDLRKKIKKQENYRLEETNSTKHYFSFIEKFYPQLDNLHITKAKKIVDELTKREALLSYIALDENNNVLTNWLFLKSNQRIIILLSSRNKEIISDASICIMHGLIKNNVNLPIKIDFEGSSIKGIREFNRGFGALESQFTIFQNLPFKL